MRLTELVTPLKPLEAMAQGQIMVASDVGGHRELIRDGNTGYLFAAGSADALAQAIERALSLRHAWDAMRLRGRRFVELEWTWAHSVVRYRDVYGRLLAPADGAGAVSTAS
jgi:glycosyltransferase involved in cell wall biosynthesis